MEQPIEADLNQTCFYHPNIETSLRCKKCEKNICSKCAIPTPTGYLCRDCEKSQQKIFETATTLDFIIASILSVVISFIGSLFISTLGFFVIILSPMVGILTSEVVRFSIQKRRSNNLYLFVVIAIAIGALPWLFLAFISGNFLNILFQGLYLVLTATTAFQRLKGIHL